MKIAIRIRAIFIFMRTDRFVRLCDYCNAQCVPLLFGFWVLKKPHYIAPDKLVDSPSPSGNVAFRLMIVIDPVMRWFVNSSDSFSQTFLLAGITH